MQNDYFCQLRCYHLRRRISVHQVYRHGETGHNTLMIARMPVYYNYHHMHRWKLAFRYLRSYGIHGPCPELYFGNSRQISAAKVGY